MSERQADGSWGCSRHLVGAARGWSRTTGSYREQDLRWWAARLGEWDRLGQDVSVSINNDGAGHAVRNTARLREVMGA